MVTLAVRTRLPLSGMIGEAILSLQKIPGMSLCVYREQHALQSRLIS